MFIFKVKIIINYEQVFLLKTTEVTLFSLLKMKVIVNKAVNILCKLYLSCLSTNQVIVAWRSNVSF